MYALGRYTLYFIIYSLLGALGETLFRFITEERLYGVNGFLHLPILPIYGFGALIIIFIAKKVKHPIPLFFAGTLAASILEFVASWLIEIIFHERIWDYTAKAFDLQGRISLETSIIFGIGGLVVVYGIHPLLIKYIARIPKRIVIVLAIVALGILATDITLTSVQRFIT